MEKFKKQTIIPVYQQIADYLREKVLTGKLSPMTRLPSEKDLAKELDVNRLTLRKALSKLYYEGILVHTSGKGTFVPEIRDGVLAKKKNLGLVFAWTMNPMDVSEDFFSFSIIQGIKRSLPDFCNLQLIKYEKKLRYADVYHNNDLDGMIIVSPLEPDTEEIIRFTEAGIPNMTLAGPINNKLNYITFENIISTISATEYLIELGHRDIAYMSTTLDLRTAQLRFKGYKLALKKHGIEYKEELVMSIESEANLKAFGNRGTIRLLESSQKFTAIVCFDHNVMLGVLRAIAEKGLKVPDDISILGFNDPAFAEYFNPPLTVLKQDFDKAGEIAVNELIKKIVDSNKKLVNMTLDTQLILRKSCAPPKKHSKNNTSTNRKVKEQTKEAV